MYEFYVDQRKGKIQYWILKVTGKDLPNYLLNYISVREIYYIFPPRNKATVVLKLALLAYYMEKYVTALIKNLRKTSECDVIFDKQRHQTLAVALLNMYYVFYIVFVERIKWCIVQHIIVQMGLSVDGVCINSQTTCSHDWLRNINRARMFVI